MLRRGLALHLIWKPMNGVGAECSAKAAGVASASAANGQQWRMSPLSMIGVSNKNSALRAFVMDQNPASFIRRENRRWCHTKAMGHVLMNMEGLMKYTRKDAAGMSKAPVGEVANVLSNGIKVK